MSAVPQWNRVWMTVTGTPGAGPVTLNAALDASWLTFAEAGVPDGAKVQYVAIDGTNMEVGEGTYTASGTVLTRSRVMSSKIGGVAGTNSVSLTSAAQVFLMPPAEALNTVFSLAQAGLAI